MDLEFAAMGTQWPLFSQNGGQSQYERAIVKNYSKHKREEQEEPE